MERLTYDFFHRHALEVAPELVGKLLVHNGQWLRISETEAYCGIADTACHATRAAQSVQKYYMPMPAPFISISAMVCTG